jgi:outer membrane protein assembly factor BamB
MQPYKRLTPSTLMFLIVISVFMSSSVSFAGSIGTFSGSWNFSILNDSSYQISLHCLDSIGQVAYFGSSNTFGYTNLLYAINVTDGQEMWYYNTSLPVTYVSHFRYNTTLNCVVAGTGGSTTSGLLQKSYVIAWPTPNESNMTLWTSINLNSSVKSLGSAESNITGTEDVIVGLENGTVIRLSGNYGTIQWQNSQLVGNIYDFYDIVQLDNGSVAVGTLDSHTGAGHIYCLEKKNGTVKWSYTQGPGIPLTLIKKFSNTTGTSSVVAVFTDGLIHVLNGTNGQDISPQDGTAFFNVGSNVKDLLCTQDYTKDGFPDIVAGTDNGSLIIVNGRNATLFRGPVHFSSFTPSYIQYMYFYENGVAYSNKTLAVSGEDSNDAYYIYGVNASDLTPIKQFSTNAKALNLFSIDTFTSNFTGNLLFTVGNTVYCLRGTDIIVPEFAPNFILISLTLSTLICLLIPILRKRLQSK